MKILFGFAVAEKDTVSILEVVIETLLFLVNHENDKPIYQERYQSV